ncbi:MAG: RnfH family protein [Gammaproteobacteria bacterium]|nr:MAG: RnfH family protein [Gammaproteobacteria bacterium]
MRSASGRWRSTVNAADHIDVEVAYARDDRQVILSVNVPEGSTAEQAIRFSGVLEQFPEISLEQNKIGIFSKLSKLDTVLKPGDRVEIYRPLIADPKEVRRKREAEGKRMKKGGGDAEAETAEGDGTSQSG